MQKPLVSKKYVLKKMPGKGGWTYIVIPKIPKSKRQAFGMLRIKGTIDDYEISDYNLMPLGDGNLILPVNAQIRKKIGKEEGELIMVTLFIDDSPLHIPEELLLCLHDEPQALQFFYELPDNEKRNYIQYIYSAKRLETQADRIAKSINKMLRGKRRYDLED